MTLGYENKLPKEVRILTNGTGADLGEGDVAIIDGMFVIAAKAVANTARGPFYVDELACQAKDFVTSTEGTFGTEGNAVYFKVADKKLSDTSTAGYYKVGIVTKVKDTAGMIVFEKLKHATVVPGT